MKNFTDVDSVYSVNPNIVSNPKAIQELTYREMRELSYAGFAVFHDEALIPAFRAQIPVVIKKIQTIHLRLGQGLRMSASIRMALSQELRVIMALPAFM
ncbi:hypothetical protein GCM10020331_076880 [Ectobacillus funiculus]